MQFHLVWLTLIIPILVTTDSNCNNEVDPVIKIKQGFLRGTRMVSTYGKKFYAFRGIPYAIPPLGELRFQPPKPGDGWKGIYNATEDGTMCPQLNLWTDALTYEEDCLTLNVYTPRILRPENNTQKQRLLPVLVYIHEGLFAAGEASSTNKPPQRLMNKDIVLVVIQYRLGPLGFLSTGDSAAPGNFGMLDQVLALQWTQANMYAFGGDANRVTICGQSAGGSSVIYHMLSPLSKGLFRGAIAQSGSALSPWAFQKDPLPWAIKLGKEVQCPTNDSTLLVSCLRQKSVQEIINATVRIDGYVLDVGPFVPVAENLQSGKFITKPPNELAKEGKINMVPLLTGATKDESAGVFYGAAQEYNSIDDKFYADTLPAVLKLLTKYNSNLTNVTSAVKEIYFDPIDVTNRLQVIQTVTNMISDIAFKAPNDLTVRVLASRNISVYMYSFEYAGNVSTTNFTGEKQIIHEDDLYYIFNRTKLTGEDLEMSDRIVDMWTNFVNDLNPTPCEFDIKWIPTSSAKELRYLKIGENCVHMKKGYLTDRMKFWNEEVPRIIENT